MKFTRMVGYVEYSTRATGEAGAEGAIRRRRISQEEYIADKLLAGLRKGVMLMSIDNDRVKVEVEGRRVAGRRWKRAIAPSRGLRAATSI